MLVSRLVASSANAFVFLLVGPRGGGAVGGHSMVSPLSQEGGCRMVAAVQRGGQVGRPSARVDKGLPGHRLKVGFAQLTN